MRRALIVEDQNLMRLALTAELKAGFPDCYIAGVQTFELATRLLADEEFDVVIIDPGLPRFDPMSSTDRLHVVERIVRSAPDALHIVVTGSDTKPEAAACRALGVAAYLGKTGLAEGELGQVLKQITRNGFSLRHSLADAHLPDIHFPGLTPREQQVIAMMMCRQPGTKRRDVFEGMAARVAIDAASAEKYYKQARAKLLKRGRLPQGL